MYKQREITTLKGFIGWICKKKVPTVQQVIKKLDKDETEDLLLHLTIKGIWVIFIFLISLYILSFFHDDSFYNTLFLLFFNFILNFVQPTSLQYVVRGDFFDKIGGNLLKYVIVIGILAYAACFVRPGWLIPLVKKVLKYHEK